MQDLGPAAGRDRPSARHRSVLISAAVAATALALLTATAFALLGGTGSPRGGEASPLNTTSASTTLAPSGVSYGASGQGDPQTSGCTVNVAAGSNIQTAINNAAAGAIICVQAADDSGVSLTINKAVTVRATGAVKIKTANLIGGNVTLDGFTIVGGAAGSPVSGVAFTGNSNKILNNLIIGHGLRYGVSCYQNKCGSGTRIANNTIAKINNYGIYMLNGDHITIEKNNVYDLYDSVNNGLDVDGMRVFGSYQTIRGNYIHDMNARRSVSSPHLDCLQHYQNSSRSDLVANITIEDNYCIRVSGMFLITKNNLHNAYDLRGYTIRGNVVETYGWQNIILSGIDGATVENNMLNGAVSGGPNITVENNPVSGAVSKNIRVRNNILVRGNAKSSPMIGTGMLSDNTRNLAWTDTSLVTAQNAFQSDTSHDIAAIDPDDFTALRTRAQSGTIVDQGATMLTTGLTADADGDARVQGAAIDVGPYEIR